MRGLIVALTLSAIFLCGCTPPADYSDGVTLETLKTVALVSEMRVEMQAGRPQTAEIVRQKALSQCKKSRKNLMKTGDFRGDTSLLNASITLLDFYTKALEKDYVDFLATHAEVYGEEQRRELRMREKTLNGCEKSLIDDLTRQTRAFAERYGLRLVEY